MNGATPGQAAYDAAYQAQADGLIGLPSVAWEDLDDIARSSWDDIAMAAGTAAQQPQPASGVAKLRSDEFARVKVRLSALVASLDETVEHGSHAEEFDQGAAHASAVTARQIREILNDTALGVTPQPAPELADAVAKSDRLEGQNEDLRNQVRAAQRLVKEALCDMGADGDMVSEYLERHGIDEEEL